MGLVTNKMEEACKNGDIEVVKYLVEKGAPIDIGAIRSASGDCHLDIVKYLFEKGVPIDATVIRSASEDGHTEIVKYLFENGAPVDTTAILYALAFGRTETVKYLVSVGAPRSAEELQSKSGRIEEIIGEARKYRTLLLPILEYKLGHPSYIVLDYLEYIL